jgi:outer membrane protein assembly factor BamD
LEVQGRYQGALRALDRGLYQDAIKDLEAIRTEFPYSQYAALSELRIADAHMRRSQYLEAIDAYRTFLRFHPSHPEAAYALGRVGEAYFAQIPKDYYLMPPAAEKDLSHVKEAIAAYEDLLARYPQASDAPEAQKHLQACQKKLADHEMYVARFYLARKQWGGVVLRCTGLLANYPNLGLDAEALYMAAQAYGQLGQIDQAVASVTRLLADYPNTQAGRRAQSLLEHLEGRMP